MDASASSYGGKTAKAKRMSRMLDHKWRFIPFLQELEPEEGEYSQSLLWVSLIVDMLQILSLVVMPEHVWSAAMRGFTVALNVVHIPLYRIGTVNAFIASMVICGLATIGYLSFLFYMAYRCVLMKRFVPGSSTFDSRVFRFYRHMTSLFSTVLFIPLIQNYLALAFRSLNSDSLQWYSSISDSSWMWNVGVSICCIGMAAHVSISLLLWNLCLEPSTHSEHPLRAANTFPDTIYVLFKAVSCILYDQFYAMDEMIFHAVWICLASLIVLIIFMVSLPYYNERMGKIRVATLWICTIYSFLGVSSHIETASIFYRDHNGVDLIIFLGTIPFFSLFFYRFLTLVRVSSSYKKAVKALKEGKLLYPVVYFPKNLPRYPHFFSHNRILLEGIESTGYPWNDAYTDNLDPEIAKELLTRRRFEREKIWDNNNDVDWLVLMRKRFVIRNFVMPYIDYIFFDSDVELSTRFLQNFERLVPVKLSGYQLRYAAILYIKGLHQFDYSGDVHLAYIHFLVDQANQHAIAIDEMQMLEKRELSLTVSYRLWKLELQVLNATKIRMKNHLSALAHAKEMHSTSLQRVVELWHILMQDSLTEQRKLMFANRILMETRATTREDYENFIYQDSGNLEALCCYAVFADQLLGDKDVSNQCLQFVQQFVHHREVEKEQGSHIQAAIKASLEQLRLSLRNSRKAFYAIKQRSNIRLVHLVLFIMLAVIICLNIVVLVFMFIKQSQVETARTDLFRWGQIRTLGAEIGYQATTVYYNSLSGSSTSLDDKKDLLGFMADFDALFNNVVFSKDARASQKIYSVLRTQPAGTYEGVVYNIWTYFGIAFANMNNMLGSVSNPSDILTMRAKWIAKEFTAELDLLVTMVEDAVTSQVEDDLSILNTITRICMVLALFFEVSIFAVLLYGYFYVQGIHSLVHAVVSLLPKAEIRVLYHRTIGQHGDLGVFLKMRPQEKVNRLLAVLSDPEMFSLQNMRTGLLLPSLFSVVPSDKGDGKYVSRLTKKKQEEQLDETQIHTNDRKKGKTKNEVNAIEIDSEVDEEAREDANEYHQKREENSTASPIALDRFMVTDCLDETEAEGPGVTSSWDADMIEEALSIRDAGASVRSTGRQRKARSTFQAASEQEYENVVSSHALLLRSDNNRLERLFTPFGLILSLLIILLLAGSIVVSVSLQRAEQDLFLYNAQEFNKNELHMDALSVVYSTTLAVVNFALTGDQRYFKKYIAAQSSTTWESFRQAVTPLDTLGSGVSPTAPFEIEIMHRALTEVTDIAMRLLCTQYAASCVTDVPFDQIYLSTLSWGPEPSLTMIQMAPQLGIYSTFFNALQGSTADLLLSDADQTQAALSVLFSDVFNSFLNAFLQKTTNVNSSPADTLQQRTRNLLITTIALSAATFAVIAGEFVYNAYRKRGGRSLVLQIAVSGVMGALCIVCIVLMSFSLRTTSNSNIDDELQTSRTLYKTWSQTLFAILWNPLMYIASEGEIIWNYKFRTTWIRTNLTALMTDLYSVSGENLISPEEIFRLTNGVMIPMVLMYEATKNLPQLAEDVSIFSPDYLNAFTWDFEAESDYLEILGKYYLVTPANGFYSTRTADLALTDPEKITLAKNTLVSYRTDDLLNSFLAALRQSDAGVSEKYSSAGLTIENEHFYGTAYIFLSVSAGIILILSNLALFIRYCRNMVSVKHIFAVTMDNEFSSADSSATRKENNIQKVVSEREKGNGGGSGSGGREGDGKGGMGNKNSSKLIVNVESTRGSTESGGAINEQLMEVEHAGRSSVAGDDVPAENGTIMESVTLSTSKTRDNAYTCAAFVMVFILLALSVVVLIMVPVYTDRMVRFVTLIDEAGQRRYMVVKSMNLMKTISLDKSSYAVTSQNLRNAYQDYITLVNKLYFGQSSGSLGGSGSTTFVNLETAQDELLFSRNRFYPNQTFYGSSMTSTTLDGIQVLTSDFDGSDDEDFLNSQYFCSFSEMMNYMSYYSRGVGITADGQWLNYLRQCFFFNLTACATMSYSYALELFDPLLVGLQQSDDMLNALVRHSGDTLFGFIVGLLVLFCVGVVAMYFIVFAPFCECLLQDDADSRMLLQILPVELRSRYPVFEELLEGKKLAKEDNQLHRIMTELAGMAVIALNEKNGIVIRFNEMAEDLLGYPASEVLGKSVAILLRDEREGGQLSQERAYELLRSARSSSKNQRSDILLQRKNGQPFTASVHFLTVNLSEDGRAIVIFLEQVEDKGRLNVLCKINRAILEMHEDGIIHMDSSGVILDANPACHRLFGWRAEELIRQNVTVLMPKAVGVYHQEYIKRYLERGVKKKIDNLTKVEGIHRDGSIVPLEIIVKEIVPPFPSALTQFVAYLRGKETEREMESASALMDVLHTLSPVPLLQVNATGEVQQLSRSASELFQYKAHEVRSYTLPVQYLVPENIEGMHQDGFIQRAHHRGPTSVIAQKRDRTTFPGVATVRQIEYCAGLPYNIFVGYICDISKTLRMEKSGRMTYSIMVHGVLPVIVIDQRGTINFFNAAATKCFLFTPEEVIGKSYRILCGGRNVDGLTNSEEGKGENREEMEDWLDPESEEYDSGERKGLFDRRRLVYGQRRTGVVFPAELVMTKVPPLNQNDEAVVILLRDLTEEKAVQRSYYMGELIDLLCPMGIVVIDPNGRIERFSPAAEDCFGYHSGEIVGAPVQTIIPGIATGSATESSGTGAGGDKTSTLVEKAVKKSPSFYPETQSSQVRVENMVEKVMTTIRGRHFDTRSLDLILHTVELSSTFISNFSPGTVVDSSYVLYCDNTSNERDIIDATNFYRSVRDVVDSPMLQANDTGKIVYVNSYAVSFFGYPNKEALLNKSVAVLFSVSGRERIQKRLKQTVMEFKMQRTNTSVAQQQQQDGSEGSAGSRGAHNAVRPVIQNEIYPCILSDGSEMPTQCTVVQVSSFLNGTIHFVFYVSPCINDVDKQMASFLNNLLIEISTLPLLLADGNGTILQNSLHTSHLFGYETAEGIIGMNIKQLLPKTSAERILQLYGSHVTSAKGNEPLITQELGCKRTGAEFPAQLSTRVVGYGTEGAILLLSLKGLERDYEDSTSSILRSMLELIAVPSVVINYRGSITHINTPLLTMFGYNQREGHLLLGKDVSILMNKQDATYHPRYMSNYFTSHVKYSIDNTIVREARHRNGHTLHVAITVREILGVSKEAKDTVFVGFFSPAPPPATQGLIQQVGTGGKEGAEGTKLLLSPSKISSTTPLASAPLGPSSSYVTTSRKVTSSAMPTEHGGRMVRNLEYWMEEKYGIPMVLLGKAGEVLRLSKAAESLLGFFPGEAKGKPLATVLSIDHYNQGVMDSLEQALEVVTTKTNATYELTITAKTRRGDAIFLNTFWRDLSGFRTKVLKDWSDMPSVLLCLQNTSAQLSATHQKLLCDTVVETCRKPTIFISTEGIVSVFNPAAEKCFGILAKDIIGKNVKMLMPQKTADMHDQILSRYLSTNVGRMIGAPREVTARRLDGTHFSAIIRIADLNAFSSRFFIGQLEDITRRKTNEVFAIMSRYMMRQTQSNLLMFDARDELVMVSPPMVKALGYDEESVVLEQRNILSQVLPPSTLRLVREFVQPYQRRGENHSFSTPSGAFEQSFNAFETLEENPLRRITSIALRLPGLVSTGKNASKPDRLGSHRDGLEELLMGEADDEEESKEPEGDTVVGNVEIHVVLSGNVFVGSVIKLDVLLEKDISEYRLGPIAQGCAKFYPKPLCVVGRNARIELCNAALAEALGYSSAQELEKAACGRLFWELFPSFPLPNGASNLEDESRIFVSIMEQLEHAVNTANAQSNRSTKEDSSRRNSYGIAGVPRHRSSKTKGGSGVQHPVLRARMMDGSGFVLQVARITTIQHLDRPSTSVRGTEAKFSLRLGAGDSAQQERPMTQSNFTEPLFFALELSKMSSEDETTPLHLEAAIPLLLGQCPVPMVVATERGIIRQVNSALEKTFDFEAEQLLGKSINILMPRGQGEMHDRYLAEYISARGSRPLVEARTVMGETKTGTPLRLNIHLKEVSMDNSKYFIATLTPQ